MSRRIRGRAGKEHGPVGALHTIDLVIIVGYLIALSSVGILFSRRQTSLEQFFLAGRRMSWVPVGISLMACLNSGIDYLMQPSAVMKYGLVLVTGALSWLLLWPWVAGVTLPFYRRLNVSTAYEYLERRFDLSVRWLASVIFILWRVGWIATAMYVPCLAISGAAGGVLPLRPTIVVLGSVVILYTALGGMRAVIWTDIIQFCIMFGGLAATVAVVLGHIPGGLSEVLQTAGDAGKTHLITGIRAPEAAGLLERIRLFFTTDMTTTGFFVAVMVGRMAVYTADQVMVQRFQTARSLKDSRQAFVINAVADALWTLGLAFVGLTLFAYVARDSAFAGLPADHIFPAFLSSKFPTGAVGLVIAAIFAASLSSIASAINSCSSVVMMDFYRRLRRDGAGAGSANSPDEERRQVRISRWTTLIVGACAITLSANVGTIGDLIEIANKVIQLFTGPLFAIYVLGLFVSFAGSRGALVGGATGAAVSLYVAFWSGLAFVWPASLGFLAALVSGVAVSVIGGRPSEEQSRFTFRGVMNDRSRLVASAAAPALLSGQTDSAGLQATVRALEDADEKSRQLDRK